MKSLLHKFVRTMLLVSAIIGLSSLAIVTWTSIQASSEYLSTIRSHIQDGITAKGKVLTQNHAIALRQLVLDNAFNDLRQLVDRAVEGDKDVVYGIYVNSGKTTLAYTSRTAASSLTDLPARDAFTAIGLSERDVIVNEESVRQVVLNGEELVEVAEPVRGEDHEVLGTVRYGLSTRRMNQALVSAKNDSDARLGRSLVLIGTLVTLATLLGILLSRIQAVRITQPVRELTDAANKLASGDREVRVVVDSGDELERLGAAFNHMVEDLNASYKQLELMNRTLEEKVLDRTRELGQRNRDMRLVLDNVDQGFVTLSLDSKMARERSRVFDVWFGESPDEPRFSDYMKRASRTFGLEFELAWEQIAEDFLPLELCIDQLPKRFSNEKGTWFFRYLPIMPEGHLEGVLVVASEVSERLAREREEAEQQELMQGFKRLMLDRSGFAAFQREATSMVNAVFGRRLENDLPALKRTLHTLKGNAGAMGLTVVARIVHSIEEQMLEGEMPSEGMICELKDRWGRINEHVANFVNQGSQDVIEVPEREYAALVSRVAQNAAQADVLDDLLSWQLEPVARSLSRLGEHAKALAQRLGKGPIEIEVQANNLKLDPRHWTPFFGELIHLIRNAVDHGIESPDERVAKSKKVPAVIVLKAESSARAIEFEIGDDGRGIPWDLIAKRARELGLPAQTNTDLVAALFRDGISGASETTETSGRGVGLAAVKQRVEAMAGKLEVRSVAGVGTTWSITLPLEKSNQRMRMNPRPPSAIS